MPKLGLEDEPKTFTGRRHKKTKHMAKVTLRKGIRIGRVVSKIVLTVLSLYVGGIVMDIIGTVLNGSHGGFYKGLTIIGYTISDTVNYSTSTGVCKDAQTGYQVVGCITQTTGSGILAVIGLVGIAAVVMEFVEFHF